MERTRTEPNPVPIQWNLARGVRIDRNKALTVWRSSRTGLLVWVIFAIFLALVQFSTADLPDNDGFYHIKLAYLMRTEGLKPDFPWLPLSILNSREFYDHHFLFHVALMPFTFGDLRVGAKWSAVFFASLALLSTWNLFKNQRIPYAWLWALGLIAVSEAFIYRMSITRAQSLSLLVLMLGLDWLLRGKNLRLAILAFVYVWLYDAFPLLLVVGGIYALSKWLVERRLDIRPVVYIGVGTLLGLIVNPYFPHNIVFAWLHILPKLTGTLESRVGNEWYPYETAQLLKNSTLSLVAFVSGALALGMSGRRIDLRTAFSFFLTCLFGLMLFQSRRFIEYFPAFSLVFAAFAWAPVLADYSTRGKVSALLVNSELRKGKARLDAFQNLARRTGLRRLLPVMALCLLLIPGIWTTLNAAKASIKASKPYRTYAGASAWLMANTDEGERVFQTDWDDFPRLFFYNTHDTYLIGLDPTYMQIYDAELYDLWVKITRGEVEKPSMAIERDFAARFVITDLRHEGFLEQASRDPGMMEVYRDQDSVVYRITGSEREILQVGKRQRAPAFRMTYSELFMWVTGG